MTERAANEAFDMLVTHNMSDMSRQDLFEIAEMQGTTAVIDGPVEKLPYEALTPEIANQAPADLAAERTRRQKSMQRALADISLWDIAV